MNAIAKSRALVVGAVVLLSMALSGQAARASETVQAGAAHSRVYNDWLGSKRTSRSVRASCQTIYVDRNETIYVSLLASYSDSSWFQGARHELILEVFENGRRLGYPASFGGYTGGWETGSWYSQPRVQFSLSTRGWHDLDMKIRAKTDGSTKTRWGVLSVYVR